MRGHYRSRLASRLPRSLLGRRRLSALRRADGARLLLQRHLRSAGASRPGGPRDGCARATGGGGDGAAGADHWRGRGGNRPPDAPPDAGAADEAADRERGSGRARSAGRARPPTNGASAAGVLDRRCRGVARGRRASHLRSRGRPGASAASRVRGRGDHPRPTSPRLRSLRNGRSTRSRLSSCGRWPRRPLLRAARVAAEPARHGARNTAHARGARRRRLPARKPLPTRLLAAYILALGAIFFIDSLGFLRLVFTPAIVADTPSGAVARRRTGLAHSTARIP